MCSMVATCLECGWAPGLGLLVAPLVARLPSLPNPGFDTQPCIKLSMVVHACYPSVCEVVTLGSKVQVLLGYIASSKPAWNPGDSHLRKKERPQQMADCWSHLFLVLFWHCPEVEMPQ